MILNNIKREIAICMIMVFIQVMMFNNTEISAVEPSVETYVNIEKVHVITPIEMEINKPAREINTLAPRLNILNNDLDNLDIRKHIISESDMYPRHDIIVASLDSLKERQEELERIEQERIAEIERKTISTIDSSDVISPYEGYITRYMDLSKRQTITVDDINYLLDYYLEINGCSTTSEFIGMGSAFIEASNLTGYDPIFLLAIAAHESGWDVSDLHVEKNNPYSINMVDTDPTLGFVMGDSFYNGIINGAIWIRENYYNTGETTLYEMIFGGKRYATSETIWIDGICNLMDTSYKLLNNR